jgi:hypothetical protein
VQAGYKLAGLNLEAPLINNVELVGRYDNMNDDVSMNLDHYSAGFVYYITNTLWFEGTYEWLRNRGVDPVSPNSFVLQLSYGF